VSKTSFSRGLKFNQWWIATLKFSANVALLTNFPNPRLSTRLEEFSKKKLVSFAIIYNGLGL